MKTIMFNIEEYANLLIGFISVLLFIGIIIEILFLTVGAEELSRRSGSSYRLNEQAVAPSGGSWADGDAGTYD